MTRFQYQHRLLMQICNERQQWMQRALKEVVKKLRVELMKKPDIRRKDPFNVNTNLERY